MSGQFDIVVIGDDEASFCAAAAVAKAGARTALIRPGDRKKKNVVSSSPAIPNFVWRRLDLQDYDLTLEPVSARVTLFPDGAPVRSFAKSRDTQDALAAAGIDDHPLWEDFSSEMRSLADNDYLSKALYGVTTPNTKSLATMLADLPSLDRAARLFGPCAELLDDYFDDSRLKTHLAAHALAAGGRGNRENGSATALAELLDEDGWRVRTPKDSQSLRAILQKVCQDCGVKTYSGKVTEVTPASGKLTNIAVGTEDKLKTRHIFFATPDAAIAAGAMQSSESSGLRSGLGGTGHASFTVRFKLSEHMDPPGGDIGAVYQIVDAGEDLQFARDAAVQGKMFDRLPVEFEFAPTGEIIARSSYLPAAFCEEGEWRGWTGQDRQAAATIIKERLTSRMPGLGARIRRTETEVATPYSGVSPFIDCTHVVIQHSRHNAISAAVKRIDEVMASHE